MSARGQYGRSVRQGRTHVGASTHRRAFVHTIELKQRYDNATPDAISALLKDLSARGLLSPVGNNTWDVALKDGAWARLLWYPDWNALEVTVSDREVHRMDDKEPYGRYDAILNRIAQSLRQHGVTAVGRAFVGRDVVAWTRGRPLIGLTDAEVQAMWNKAAKSYGSGPGYLGSPSSSTSTPDSMAHELTPQEDADARAASDRAVEPLRLQRLQLRSDWKKDAALSAGQMTQVMNAAVEAARKTVDDLSTMIAKVPSHWEGLLRNERTVINGKLDQAAGWNALIAQTNAPTVLPGFRKWIDGLLSVTEDGIMAIAYVAHVLPNWLRMRDLLSTLYEATIRLISGIVSILQAAGGAALDLAKNLPTVGKILGIGALVVGGVWAISKVRGTK